MVSSISPRDWTLSGATTTQVAQSAGAVKYTDCFSAEG